MKLFERVLPHYITHRNYINKGLNEINTVRYIAQIALLAKIAFPKLPVSGTALLGIGLISGCWGIGKCWDMMKAYHLETEWSNTRNPTIQDIRDSVHCSERKGAKTETSQFMGMLARVEKSKA